MVGAMRYVAIHAVFAYRRMLPKEGTALLRVALIALIVDRGLGDHAVSLGPMRIVAICAADLALTNRVMRGLPDLCPDVGMAGKTLLHRRRSLELALL